MGEESIYIAVGYKIHHITKTLTYLLSILEEMDSGEMSIAFYTSLENEGWVSLVLVIPLLSFLTKM